MSLPSLPLDHDKTPLSPCTMDHEVPLSQTRFDTTTAMHNTRYEDVRIGDTKHTMISAGIFCRNPCHDLPTGWQALAHPEGGRYYFNSTYRFVTENQIDDAQVRGPFLNWVAAFLALLEEQSFELPVTSEVFLQMSPDTRSCAYYMVDHEHRLEYWLEPVASEKLDIAEPSSLSHLRHALEEHYWTHVQYFPHHRISWATTRELLDVLTYGSGDQLTSRDSTFPYNSEQCDKLLSLIRTSNVSPVDSTYEVSTDSHGSSMELTWTVARIWGTVARHRFDTFYGEPHARISRSQRRTEYKPAKTTNLTRVLSFVLWGVPRVIHEEMQGQWVDQMMYAIHWAPFGQKMLRRWNQVLIPASAALVSNLMMLRISNSMPSRIGGLIAGLISSMALISSVALAQHHENLPDMTASEAHILLYNVEEGDPNMGLQRIAIVWGLPGGLVRWAVALLGVQFLMVMYEASPILVLTVWLVAMAVMIMLLFWGTGIRGMRRIHRCVTRLYSRRRGPGGTKDIESRDDCSTLTESVVVDEYSDAKRLD